jgi:hypothetical protein
MNKGRRFKHGPEELQMMLFYDLCKIELMQPKASPIWALGFHIPNESKCSIQRRITLGKCMVRPGIPDLFFAMPTKNHHGLFIEMKVKPNRPTPAQLKWIQWLNEQDYMAVVAYSADEAIEYVKRYLAGESSPLP